MGSGAVLAQTVKDEYITEYDPNTGLTTKTRVMNPSNTASGDPNYRLPGSAEEAARRRAESVEVRNLVDQITGATASDAPEGFEVGDLLAANGPAVGAMRSSEARAASEANFKDLKQRVSQKVGDFWAGEGEFAPTTADNQSLWSAVKDTGRAAWNVVVGVGELSEMTPQSLLLRRFNEDVLGLEMPRAAKLMTLQHLA
jgi:hypothetical protein